MITVHDLLSSNDAGTQTDVAVLDFGIQTASDLRWTAHISGVCRRAGSTLGFLRRSLQNCSQECRRKA